MIVGLGIAGVSLRVAPCQKFDIFPFVTHALSERVLAASQLSHRAVSLFNGGAPAEDVETQAMMPGEMNAILVSCKAVQLNRERFIVTFEAQKRLR